MFRNMSIKDLPFFSEVTDEEVTNTFGGVTALGDGIQKGIGRIRVDLTDILDDPNYSGDFVSCSATGNKLQRQVTITCNLPKGAVFFLPPSGEQL